MLQDIITMVSTSKQVALHFHQAPFSRSIVRSGIDWNDHAQHLISRAAENYQM